MFLYFVPLAKSPLGGVGPRWTAPGRSGRGPRTLWTSQDVHVTTLHPCATIGRSSKPPARPRLTQGERGAGSPGADPGAETIATGSASRVLQLLTRFRSVEVEKVAPRTSGGRVGKQSAKKHILGSPQCPRTTFRSPWRRPVGPNASQW